MFQTGLQLAVTVVQLHSCYYIRILNNNNNNNNIIYYFILVICDCLII